MGMSVPILTLGTPPSAIGERGFETIKVGSQNIHVLVCDKTGQVLTDTLPHDTCFAVMHSEALFDQNGSDMSREPLNAPLE
jgi:hypothetical protein